MLNIELVDYGVEDALKQISEDLNVALSATSKNRKNEMVYKALGAVDALYILIRVTDTESESDT